MTDAMNDTAPTFVITDDAPFEETPRATTFLDDEPTPIEVAKKRRGTKIENELSALYMSAAMMIAIADPQLGQMVAQQTPDCAKAFSELAAKNPRVRRALEAMLETSAWSAVVAAHLPIAVFTATKYIPTLRDKLQADANAAQQ